MSQAVDLDVFYPHPPERVWQVLTDRHALARWMMENNFEPRVGHRFQFYSQPLPGLKTAIQCEVVELDEPKRLAYTWQDSPTSEPSLVVWTLNTVAGGTQLRLKHYQHSYATAVAKLKPGAIAGSSSGSFPSAQYTSTLSLHEFKRTTAVSSSLLPELFTNLSQPTIAAQFSGAIAWDYWLNQTLPELLSQKEITL